MTARQQRRHERCLDCDTPVDGNFCSHCGQENSDYRVSLKRLLGDLFEELFQLESRLWRSLYDLFRHPGLLTVDYNAGRRVRYTSPLRLYLIASVAYFFALTVLPQSKSNMQIQFDGGNPELAELQSSSTSALDRRMKERLGFKKGADMRVVQQNARDLLNVNAPRVMAALMPLFALLMMLFFRRPSHFFVEHLVLALHLHAVAFWLLLFGELTRYEHASAIALLPTMIWLLLALRVVFAQAWWVTIVKTLSVAMFYGVLVIFGIIVALLI